MPPDHQQATTGLAELLNDPLFSHQIDAIFEEQFQIQFLNQVLDRAQKLGIEIEHPPTATGDVIIDAIAKRVTIRILNLLTKDQRSELEAFAKHNDSLSTSIHLVTTYLKPADAVDIADSEIDRSLADIILIQLKEHAIDSSIMGVNAQHIIERAQAETPDAINELQEIVVDATELKDTLTKLHELDNVSSRTEAEVAITGLHEIATRSQTAARQLGLRAIEQGLISQNKLARLLGVSQMTISRWYREDLDKPEEQ